MNTYIIMAIVFGVALIMTILPRKAYFLIGKVFSMHKMGIRKQPRLRSYTDTLGNMMIGISIIFCVLYCFIPFYSIIYAVFFVFTYLCTLSQAFRVTRKKPQSVCRTVLFLLNGFSACAFLAALGYFNNQAFIPVINTFTIDFFSKKAFDILYLLQNRTWMYYLTQAVIFLFPLVFLWNQFKYMRLESSVKAVYFVTYIIKMIFVTIVFVAFCYEAFQFLDLVYQVEALKNAV